MEEVKQFFIQNWQLIASAVLFIIATTIGITRSKKKGMSFMDALHAELCEALPIFISCAEGKGTGEQKRVYVLNEGLNYLAKKIGRPLTQTESDLAISYMTEQIENILATPQKKGIAKKVR